MDMNETRSLSTIAREIRADWTKPYFGAVPYLEAMGQLDQITDRYYMETADSMVRYFLSNAGTWKGDVARRVKAELKKMVGLK
jgi:hypothetical protein